MIGSASWPACLDRADGEPAVILRLLLCYRDITSLCASRSGVFDARVRMRGLHACLYLVAYYFCRDKSICTWPEESPSKGGPAPVWATRELRIATPS